MEVTNKVTGVRISVSEDAARRLGPEWEEKRAPASRAPRKKAEKKSPDDERATDSK